MANCCIIVNTVVLDYENYYPTEQVFVEGVFVGYQVGEGEASFFIELTDPENGSWAITSIGGSTIFAEIENLGECPASSSEDWTFVEPAGFFDSFTIIEIPCDITEYIEEPNTIATPDFSNVISCQYKNLLKKQKAILAKEIADLKSAEILQLKTCSKKWDKIYEKYLIISALGCCPYDEYSTEDEKCLIGHLTDNCNC